MKIVIHLGDDVSTAAEARIKQAVAATAKHRAAFQGDSIAVQRGDFTCIHKGAGHSQAARLFGFVQALAQENEAFKTDDDGRLLVPLYDGGFERVMRAGRKPLPEGAGKTARVQLKLTESDKAAWLRKAEAAGLTLQAWVEQRCKR
jgi:hypothetical protein